MKREILMTCYAKKKFCKHNLFCTQISDRKYAWNSKKISVDIDLK